MAITSPGRYKVTAQAGRGWITFGCPCGCGDEVCIPIRTGDKVEDMWKWNGSSEKPTLEPSIRRLQRCRWHGHLNDGVWSTQADGAPQAPNCVGELIKEIEMADEKTEQAVVSEAVFDPGKPKVEGSVLDVIDDVTLEQKAQNAAAAATAKHVKASEDALAARHLEAQQAAEANALAEIAAAEAARPKTAQFVDLDKRRPYGSVQPPQGRQHYVQDGKYFDHLGALVEEE